VLKRCLYQSESLGLIQVSTALSRCLGMSGCHAAWLRHILDDSLAVLCRIKRMACNNTSNFKSVYLVSDYI
jgi:hypothetical protein